MSYFLQMQGLGLVSVIGEMMAGSSGSGLSGPGILIAILAGILAFIPIVRRLHDLDRSGWWALFAFVPLVNFIFGLYLLFKRGTEGPNRYGADPLSGR
jgi:uncharacterized membrane protein YhaH (DUF805 family)